MPNHVAHRLTLTGPVEDVAELVKLVIVPDKDNEKSFDFNRIVQMPPILLRVRVPVKEGPNGRTMLHPEGDIHGFGNEVEATEEEQKILDSISPADWYNWAMDNWGTKWNSYEFGEITNHATYEFRFETAWSPPEPVINAMAAKFPNVAMDLKWFDEGWCHAGEGSLNTPHGNASVEEMYTEPTPAIFAKVHDLSPVDEWRMEQEHHQDLVFAEHRAILDRLADNFTCYDVADESDAKGYFPLTSTVYSDDPVVDEDDLAKHRQARAKIRDATLALF